MYEKVQKGKAENQVRSEVRLSKTGNGGKFERDFHPTEY